MNNDDNESTTRTFGYTLGVDGWLTIKLTIDRPSTIKQITMNLNRFEQEKLSKLLSKILSGGEAAL